MTIKEIDTYDAIKLIFKTNDFPVLKSHLESEVYIENDNIYYVYINDKDLSDNIYTNDSILYKWIAVIENEHIVALQLLQFNEDYIELVIIEKVKKYNVHNVFRNVLKYVEKTYKPNKIYTFPLHDKLKEEYKKYGFIEEDKELIKIINES